MGARAPSGQWLRSLFLALGLIFLVLAVLGLFLPLLPTTPFLLLAAACFARSSERLHGWMLRHRRFGPLLKDWESQGAIDPSSKRVATVAILASLVLSFYLAPLPPAAHMVVATVMAGVLAFIWSRPDGKPSP